jgi:hypothetical protein
MEGCTAREDLFQTIQTPPTLGPSDKVVGNGSSRSVMAKGWHDLNGEFIRHKPVDNPLARREFGKSIGLNHEIKKRNRNKRAVNYTVNSEDLCVDVVFLRCICKDVCNGNDLFNKQPLGSVGMQILFDGEGVIASISRWE